VIREKKKGSPLRSRKKRMKHMKKENPLSWFPSAFLALLLFPAVLVAVFILIVSVRLGFIGPFTAFIMAAAALAVLAVVWPVMRRMVEKNFAVAKQVKKTKDKPKAKPLSP
jgi:hypothetical protein